MLQLNRAKFSANGNCGYVLKPQSMCQGEARGPGRGAGAPRDRGRQRPPATWQVTRGCSVRTCGG